MEDDQLICVLPIHYSNALSPNIQIHQFPVLSRPLRAPPSAIASGRRIKARCKPGVRRIEIHVPVDTRPEVWNSEKAKVLGVAQADDDLEKNQESLKAKQKEGERARLSEVRLRSEQIPQKGVYMLGVVRDGQLHLHSISETHQLRPTLTYLDFLSRKSKRPRAGVGTDSESDDGPPLDPDEPAPVPSPKREKKPLVEAKEAQVSARKVDDKGGPQVLQGGLSSVRRDILSILRVEEEERWQDLEFCGSETEESAASFEAVFSRSGEVLQCQTEITAYLKDIQGL